MPKPKQPKLDRRARFAQEYAKDLNATQAAIRAGYAPGAAKVTGSRLLADPDVRDRVERILARAQEAAAITVERTMQEIARLAYSDPRKLYDEHGNLRSVHQLDDDAAATVAGVEVEEIIVGGKVIGRLKKFKRWDKGRALEQCMSILGMHKTAKPGEGEGLNLTIRLSDERRRG